jgi:hypothetical protein
VDDPSSTIPPRNASLGHPGFPEGPRSAPPSVVHAIPKKHAREAEAIDEIVQTCLKKDAGERFQTMEELRRALMHVLRRIEPHH